MQDLKEIEIVFINDNSTDKSVIIINNFPLFGDWGLGIGDWGLGIGPNPQSPIPIPTFT